MPTNKNTVKIEMDDKKTEWKIKLDFYDKLFESYRREIDCLWHRSVFLGTFLVLIFTGYGGLVKLWFERFIDTCAFSPSFFPRYKFNIVMLVISFLGVIFSILWILMAKGSKAWQEVYERKIKIFEDYFGISKIVADDDSCELFAVEHDDIEPKLLSKCSPEEVNDCVFSMKAGKYSVSKINVYLGVIFYVVWGLAFCFHFISLFVPFSELRDLVLKCSIFACMRTWKVWMLFLIAIMIVIVITVWLKIRNKSEGFGK